MRYRTKLHVDFGILENNFELLKNIAPKNETLFMVKANAYGHGMIPIVQYSNQCLKIRDYRDK